MVVQHSAATLRKRLLLTRLWKVVVIGWAIIRTGVIWAALGKYGFNPWFYLAIDLVCSIVDAITTPRMVLGFIDGHYTTASKWGAVALVAFVIPDVYVFADTNSLPTKVIVVFCAIILAFLCLAVVGVVRKVLKGRAALGVMEAFAGGAARG